MAILPILIAPDKRLKRKSVPVAQVDNHIRQLLNDMLETMYAAPGVGLAAPQVGVELRVIVMDVTHNKENGCKQPIRLVNPIIIAQEGEIVWEEGCLSVPEHYAKVDRTAQVTVQALDENGQPITLTGTGLLAVCLQHEIDHLDGVLFIDRISRLKRDIILKKLKKKIDEEPGGTVI